MRESSARSEALKARCRQRHFDAIGIPFDVAVTADQIERAWNAPGIRYT